MRPRLRTMSAIVALAATILVVAPVAATSQWTTSSQAGISAFASDQTCMDKPEGVRGIDRCRRSERRRRALQLPDELLVRIGCSNETGHRTSRRMRSPTWFA